MNLKIFISLLFLPLLTFAQTPKSVVDGNNKFAFELYREIKGNGKNVICSPFSISTALAMTYAGARGETAKEMSSVLNFGKRDGVHREFKVLIDEITKGSGGDITLNIANGLWAQRDFRFLDSYFDQVRTNYGAVLRNVDFKSDTARENTRKEINGWVEKTTHDKIKDLLSSGDLSDMTRLVLVNAIYFFGNWQYPFEKSNTRPDNFYPDENSSITAPFMNQTAGVKYYEDTKIQVIGLPYTSDKASMLIFLPVKRDGIGDLEKSLDNNYYQKILDNLQTERTRISIPKFTTTFKTELNKSFSVMGMPLAFSDTEADFSGMTGNRDLYISKVIHQAFIRVDELGSEAAAATAVIGELMMARPESDLKTFVANHPFIFCIRDNATGSILFIGRITNPV